MRALITIGCPGSGKTTEANLICRTHPSKWVKIDYDDLRFTLFGVRGWEEYEFTEFREGLVVRLAYAMVEECARSGISVVLSETNLGKNTREAWIRVLEELGYEVMLQEFDVPLEELLRRDKERGIYSVGESVILQHHEQWLRFKAGY